MIGRNEKKKRGKLYQSFMHSFSKLYPYKFRTVTRQTNSNKYVPYFQSTCSLVKEIRDTHK